MAITEPGQYDAPLRVSGGGIDLKALLDELLGGYRAGQQERSSDKAEGIAALRTVLDLFGPGYGKGTEKRAQAKFAQGAVGRGLAGSTVPTAISAGLGQEFEDMRRGRLGGALSNLAQFFSSFDAQRPSAGTIAHLATGGFGAYAGAEAQNPPPSYSGSVDYGNQQGLGYQPPSQFGQGSVSGSVAGGASAGAGGSAWGGLSGDIAQTQQRSAFGPTFSGMIAGQGAEHEATDYTSWLNRVADDWLDPAALDGAPSAAPPTYQPAPGPEAGVSPQR